MQLELMPTLPPPRERPMSVWAGLLRHRDDLAPWIGAPEVDDCRARLELGARRGLSADDAIALGVRSIGLLRRCREGLTLAGWDVAGGTQPERRPDSE